MRDQWFFEKTIPEILDESRTSIKIKKKIYSGKSSYQKIEVFDTLVFGRMLVLDRVVQLSQIDEFIYHEMLVHLAMFSHQNPKKVLIIGGGDGGALREVLKHPIEEACVVDIDKKVIEISKKYLPFVSKGAFKNKRAKIFIEDGIKFTKKYKNFFDIIILDSTDPSGLSIGFFHGKFYQDVSRALAENGVLIIQSGCIFEQFLRVKSIYNKLKKIFFEVKIHQACIPSLQCSSEYIFILALKSVSQKPNYKNIKQRYKKLNLDLEYYNPEIHFSSAVLPKYLAKKLNVNT
ncbi:MAG: polyamine aminopropyltransferase [Candidatus Nealsonbacteria bacterium]|nr:polyamine aminopropyltransferase [Candidatus Nealsonbacteria bacterium]